MEGSENASEAYMKQIVCFQEHMFSMTNDLK